MVHWIEPNTWFGRGVPHSMLNSSYFVLSCQLASICQARRHVKTRWWWHIIVFDKESVAAYNAHWVESLCSFCSAIHSVEEIEILFRSRKVNLSKMKQCLWNNSFLPLLKHKIFSSCLLSEGAFTLPKK